MIVRCKNNHVLVELQDLNKTKSGIHLGNDGQKGVSKVGLIIVVNDKSNYSKDELIAFSRAVGSIDDKLFVNEEDILGVVYED